MTILSAADRPTATAAQGVLIRSYGACSGTPVPLQRARKDLSIGDVAYLEEIIGAAAKADSG